MSPIIIERNDFLKFGTLALVLLSGVFLSGVLYGYSKAGVRHGSTVDTYVLALPDAAVMVAAERSARVPATVAPGHDRDVDRARHGDDSGAHQHAGVEQQPRPAAASTVALADTGEAANDAPAAVGGPPEPEEEDPLTLMKDTADEAGARYTVQIGLFADEGNAERRVESLQAKNINAYATTYTDSNKRLMFNVRFGYFDNRHNARAALDAFENLFAAEGYLVSMNR